MLVCAQWQRRQLGRHHRPFAFVQVAAATTVRVDTFSIEVGLVSIYLNMQICILPIAAVTKRF